MKIISGGMNISSKIKFLYLYGAALYALLGIVFIFLFPDFARITKEGNQFIIDSRIKLYWGLLFGPVFFLFAFPPVLNALRNMKKINSLEFILFLWLAADLLACAVGIIRGNSIRYIVSDAFILAIIPLSYYLIKGNIRDAAQVKDLFYFALLVQFLLISFPMRWAIMSPHEHDGVATIGFYTYHSMEAFVTVALLTLALFSDKRWFFATLSIIAIVVSLYRTRSIYFIQILIPIFMLFCIHIFNKGFIKRFVQIFSVIFVAVFILLYVSGFLKVTYPYVKHAMYLKASQVSTAISNKIFKKAEIPKKTEIPKKIVIGQLTEGEKALEVQEKGVVKVPRPKWEIFNKGEYKLESTVKKVGENGLLLNNTNPVSPFYANQRISDYFQRFYFDGRRLTFGCWVYSTVPGKIHIGIRDYNGKYDFKYSPYHSGSGRWEFLTVSKIIRKKCDTVDLQLFAEEGGEGYFDGAIVAEGEIKKDDLQFLVDEGNDLLERFEVIPLADSSLGQRFYEVGVVKAAFEKSNPWLFLFGFGNGATLDLSTTPDVTMRIVYKDKINAVHSIHFLPLAVLYRQGIIGLFIFIAMIGVIFFYFFTMAGYFRTLNENAIIVEILFLTIFVTLLAGLTATPHFFTSVTAGFALGMIGVIRNEIKVSGGENANTPD